VASSEMRRYAHHGLVQFCCRSSEASTESPGRTPFRSRFGSFSHLHAGDRMCLHKQTCPVCNPKLKAWEPKPGSLRRFMPAAALRRQGRRCWRRAARSGAKSSAPLQCFVRKIGDSQNLSSFASESNPRLCANLEFVPPESV
jgi:hypothetical protein